MLIGLKPELTFLKSHRMCLIAEFTKCSIVYNLHCLQAFTCVCWGWDRPDSRHRGWVKIICALLHLTPWLVSFSSLLLCTDMSYHLQENACGAFQQQRIRGTGQQIFHYCASDEGTACYNTGNVLLNIFCLCKCKFHVFWTFCCNSCICGLTGLQWRIRIHTGCAGPPPASGVWVWPHSGSAGSMARQWRVWQRVAATDQSSAGPRSGSHTGCHAGRKADVQFFTFQEVWNINQLLITIHYFMF